MTAAVNNGGPDYPLEPDVDLKRGVHVVVMFNGVLDSRPQNGIARVRPVGHAGWIAVVPEDALDGVAAED